MTSVSAALVPIDRIRFHPHNVRAGLGDLRPLTSSILRHGIMQPVVVERRGTDFRLRAGHRRIAAARLAGLTRVPAIIHASALNDREWLMAAVEENEHRRNLDQAERTRTVRALRELHCSWEGVAEAFGVGVSTVQAWARQSIGEGPDAARVDPGPPEIAIEMPAPSKPKVDRSAAIATSAARRRAVDRLIQAHPDEYASYLAEETA